MKTLHNLPVSELRQSRLFLFGKKETFSVKAESCDCDI